MVTSDVCDAIVVYPERMKPWYGPEIAAGYLPNPSPNRGWS